MPWWVWLPLTVIAALAATVWVVGAMLPRRHRVTRHIRLRRSRSEVWTRITDFAGQPEWRPDMRAAERVDDIDAREMWREWTGEWVTLETLESAYQERLVRRIVPTGLAYGGSWTIVLEDDGNDVTLVTLTEDGEVYSPMARFVSRFVLGHHRTVDGYLRALAASFGQPAARPFS